MDSSLQEFLNSKIVKDWEFLEATNSIIINFEDDSDDSDDNVKAKIQDNEISKPEALHNLVIDF